MATLLANSGVAAQAGDPGARAKPRIRGTSARKAFGIQSLLGGVADGHARYWRLPTAAIRQAGTYSDARTFRCAGAPAPALERFRSIDPYRLPQRRAVRRHCMERVP